MKNRAIVVFLLACAGPTTFAAEPRLIGRAEIASAVPDKSGAFGSLGGIPADQWGGYGSGIAWLGRGNRYAMISDRGPADGQSAYRCRYHIVEIIADEKANSSLTVKLLETHLLTSQNGVPLIGSRKALPEAKDPLGVRFDPEAIRVNGQGTLFISDEYGPSILEFAANGRQTGQLPIPRRFLPAHPSADPEDELPPTNVQGRQPNRGLECLAISPDGNIITALLQGPLIQDGALDEMNKRIGTNLRLLEINRATRTSREYLYPLDQPSSGCNEIEYLSPGRFLVIERDSKSGAEAAVKNIVEIDIGKATDISQIRSLPSTEIPKGVTAISKRPFLNLLDPKWKLAGESFPEKIEGIALGPKLKDGSRVLLITSDNDFLPAPTQIYAFAIRP